MEEQRTHISQGKAEAFLVCDKSLGDSDAPFFSWLRSEGFTFACYNWNYGCYWALPVSNMPMECRELAW